MNREEDERARALTKKLVWIVAFLLGMVLMALFKVALR